MNFVGTAPAVVQQSFRALQQIFQGPCRDRLPSLAGVGGIFPWDLVLHPLLPAPAGRTDSSPLWPQIQNLGLFPIHGVMMKMTVPIATRGGNRLLMLRDFLTDQVPVPSEPARGRRVPKSSDLSSSSDRTGASRASWGEGGRGGGRSRSGMLSVPVLVVRLVVCGPCVGEHVL